MACKRRADLVADLREKISFRGACGLGGLAGGDEAPFRLALAAKVAQERAKLRGVARADARQRQRQGDRGAVAISPDDLQRPKGFSVSASAAQAFEPCGGLGMALRREQHEEALAADLVLMVAEQALRWRVQGQDAASQVERDGAVARPVEHRLKVAARQTAGGRRVALGDA